MAKSQLRKQARELRQQGKSIKSIVNELGVAQSTVSLWCRDIVLSVEQVRVLEEHARDPFYGRRLENVRKQQRLRREKTERLRKEGATEVGVLSKRELLLVGIALYWAEGYKKDNQVGLGSSDPQMILLFVKWLSLCFGYTTEDLLFRVTVNEAHEYRISKITEYWSELLHVPILRFQKPFYQHVAWKKEYDNPDDYYGVLRIRVRRSSDFLRKIHEYIAGLKGNV